VYWNSSEEIFNSSYVLGVDPLPCYLATKFVKILMTPYHKFTHGAEVSTHKA
jgi:hypothetical protein